MYGSRFDEAGIEYVISEKVFEGLPMAEREYWHSHKHEVESGMLKLGMKSVVPGEHGASPLSRRRLTPVGMMDDMAERPAMLELHRTYGKTIHTWYAFRSSTPLPPDLIF